jgi:hypothetical protein
MRKPVADAVQGENWLESGAYTAVREHFEPFSTPQRAAIGFLMGLLRQQRGEAGL